MGRPRLFDEAQLLERAFEQMWQRGYHRTSLADISRAAGIERASLYNAYGSKEALFLKAWQHYADSYLEAIAEPLENTALTLEEQLLGYCQVSIENFCAGQPSRSCPTTRGLMELDLWDAHGDPTSARIAFGHLIQSVISKVTGALKRGQAEGTFAGDPTSAAEQLVATVRGLVILERAYASRADLLRIAGNTVRLLIH